jgi:hypothetical protein
VLTEIGPIEIAVPRDTMSTFEPQIDRKRPRRLTGVDEIVLSLTARGLTTGKMTEWLNDSRYLTQDDGIEIADRLAAGEPVKSIAARIGRSNQIIYREIARNGKPR